MHTAARCQVELGITRRLELGLRDQGVVGDVIRHRTGAECDCGHVRCCTYSAYAVE